MFGFFYRNQDVVREFPEKNRVHLAWIRTKSNCTHQITDEAREFLSLQFSLTYQTLTETLSSKQVSYLVALMSNEEEICSRYPLQNTI